MRASLNNMLVDSLRGGNPETVRGIISMGMTPLLFVDKVEGDAVASRTVWGWTHQAPDSDASRECWKGWLERKLSTLNRVEAEGMLKDLMDDAIPSALASGQSTPLVSTWKQVEQYANDRGLQWTRDEGISTLAHRLPLLPSRAVPVLKGLQNAGLLERDDLLGWVEAPTDPWQQVAGRGLDSLLSWMLHACRPVPAGLLAKVEGVLWERLEESLSQGAAAHHWGGFTVRLLSSLDLLGSFGPLTPLGEVPKEVLEQMERVEKNPQEWSGEVVSALTQWKMLRGLSPATSRPSLRPTPRF